MVLAGSLALKKTSSETMVHTTHMRNNIPCYTILYGNTYTVTIVSIIEFIYTVYKIRSGDGRLNWNSLWMYNVLKELLGRWQVGVLRVDPQEAAFKAQKASR